MAEWIIDLLRHGEAEGGNRFRGRTDDALTGRGRDEMHRVTADRGGWREIISSPARRCAGFAGALAEARALPCRQAEWLWEMDFGDWEGMTAAELAKTDAERLKAFWQDPLQQTPPGGEPFRRFRQRVLAGWRGLLQRAAGPVLLVSHGGPIRVILAEVLGMPPQNLLRLELPHAALCRVRISVDAAGEIHGSLMGLNIGTDR